MLRKYVRKLHKVLLITLVLKTYFVNGEFKISNTSNKTTVAVKNLSSTSDVANICEKQKCIAKCCPNGEYVELEDVPTCVSYENLKLDFSDVPVYDENIYDTGKTVKDVFHLVPKGTVPSLDVNITLAFDGTIIGLRPYLTVSGILQLESPNEFIRWYQFNSSKFCLDYVNLGAVEPKFLIIFDDVNTVETNLYFVSCAMLISCVFLLLVLIVYCVLPELRNLGGLVLMSYVTSLLGAFILLATLQLLSIYEQNPENVCVGLTFSIYYFFLATFCWMNIMSFDIWWTFRGYAKARPIHRRGEHFKFLMYSIYAWGVPLAMTIFVWTLNTIDISHIPWFIKPKVPLRGCFIEGGERLLYLYVPMLILIFSNWIFFLLTAYSVWRLNRGTNVLESAAAGTPAAHRTQRQRFAVYLKLSVIMGISWVLEAVSSLKPELKLWYITDSYNLLIGIAIFLIFVCKRKIFLKLRKRFHSWKKSEWAPYSSRKSRSSSTTISDVSQETPLNVCSNPAGISVILNNNKKA